MIKLPEDKKIIGWGTGSLYHHLAPNLECEYLVDNNESKQGLFIDGHKVLSPEVLSEENKSEVIILILSSYTEEIINQLKSYGFSQNQIITYKEIKNSYDYWERRKHCFYYKYVLRIAKKVAPNAENILDVGSANTKYLRKIDWIPQKVSLDLEKNVNCENIRHIKADFLSWDPNQVFDLVLCLQVLEHVKSPGEFAQKLLNTGEKLIVSVPYKWDKKQTQSHVHDPVDLSKVEKWFNRPAQQHFIISEVIGNEAKLNKAKRLVCYFH